VLPRMGLLAHVYLFVETDFGKELRFAMITIRFQETGVLAIVSRRKVGLPATH
jgi:hypothetical protein